MYLDLGHTRKTTYETHTKQKPYTLIIYLSYGKLTQFLNGNSAPVIHSVTDINFRLE